MRISAKGRYGLAAMIVIAQGNYDSDTIPVTAIADKLGLSKIYLEQVFSLLKRAGLVTSIKGAQGGYRLTREPSDISVYEILDALEQVLFERTEDSVLEQAPAVEKAMRTTVFTPLDEAVQAHLSAISLEALVTSAGAQNENYMFFI
ncbi:MAG: Rrf2 family transcriptional regulator [Eubacterium sp.]|nr:Rrf2 family transcriptional regulator [Eubacterium sp.]